MTDIVTDTKEFTVTIIQHANVIIKNLTTPTSVESGEDFTITYDATNNGATDSCYGRVVDVDSNSEIANSYWTESISTGSTKNCSIVIPGKTTQHNLKIEVGYQK